MLLEVKDVDFHYGNRKVLDKITFSAKNGEFIGILGPNGSGKTTLLDCISSKKPSHGEVLLDGKSIHNLKVKEIARNVAFLTQGATIDFPFKVLEVVLMGRNPYIDAFHSESEKDLKIAKNAMGLTRTTQFADRCVTELSGGELQRVLIARALAQEPKLLLLDEPIVHLDINHQLEILDLVKNQCKNGICVIAVLHELNLASRYCDRLILLNNGKIVSEGLQEDVLTPENIRKVFHTDALIKKNPMTNSIYVMPYPKTLVEGKDKRVHVLCGGSSGALILKMLLDRGYKVTAGVLNVLDTDYEVAGELGIPVVGELPFSSISQESHNANLELIDKADFVIATDFPVGWGNLKNLEAIGRAIYQNIPAIMVETAPLQERDFTDGAGTRVYESLKKRGLTIVNDLSEGLKKIEEVKKK